MKNVFDVLKERGFIKQTVYEDDLYNALGNQSVSFYVGFDPTADSLHIGHYIPIMAMAWLTSCLPGKHQVRLTDGRWACRRTERGSRRCAGRARWSLQR